MIAPDTIFSIPRKGKQHGTLPSLHAYLIDEGSLHGGEVPGRKSLSSPLGGFWSLIYFLNQIAFTFTFSSVECSCALCIFGHFYSISTQSRVTRSQ